MMKYFAEVEINLQTLPCLVKKARGRIILIHVLSAPNP